MHENNIIFQKTHCLCPTKLGQGKLNTSCEMMKSVNFTSDLIGINTFDDNYQFAMYKVLDSTLDLQGEPLHSVSSL